MPLVLRSGAQRLLAQAVEMEVTTFWPMVRECFMLAGEVDFLLKVVATDWDAYQTWEKRDLSARRYLYFSSQPS